MKPLVHGSITSTMVEPMTIKNMDRNLKVVKNAKK
jgi:hypothetical protein